MKAKEVAKLLANRVNQEHYILDLMTKLYEIAYEEGKKKSLNVSDELVIGFARYILEKPHMFNNGASMKQVLSMYKIQNKIKY